MFEGGDRDGECVAREIYNVVETGYVLSRTELVCRVVVGCEIVRDRSPRFFDTMPPFQKRNVRMFQSTPVPGRQKRYPQIKNIQTNPCQKYMGCSGCF